MNYLKLILLAMLIVAMPFTFSHCIVEEGPIEGCTCSTASNYNPNAEEDDGSCEGCLNLEADNFSSCAVVDDGTCQISGCTNSGALNYNPSANVDDNSCMFAERPTLSINASTAITHESITFNAEILEEGSSSVTNTGFYYSTSEFFDTDAATRVQVDPNSAGEFSATISGLIRNRQYYVQAYATNSEGTSLSIQTAIATDALVHDIQGNTYGVLSINNQSWTTENLIVTTLNDSTEIMTGLDNSSWSSTNESAYAWYNDDKEENEDFGILYNGFAVETGKLCPVGWHVPTSDEWNTLITTLEGTSLAGGKLKQSGTVYWNSPNVVGTSSSGFGARGAGFRQYNTGSYLVKLSNAFFWSSSETTATSNSFYHTALYNDSQRADYLGTAQKKNGFSVRCIED